MRPHRIDNQCLSDRVIGNSFAAVEYPCVINNVPTVTTSSWQCNRVVWLLEATFESPYYPVPLCALFLTDRRCGSPADMYGLPLHHFLTEVNGVVTKDFIGEIKKLMENKYCQSGYNSELKELCSKAAGSIYDRMLRCRSKFKHRNECFESYKMRYLRLGASGSAFHHTKLLGSITSI